MQGDNGAAKVGGLPGQAPNGVAWAGGPERAAAASATAGPRRRRPAAGTADAAVSVPGRRLRVPAARQLPHGEPRVALQQRCVRCLSAPWANRSLQFLSSGLLKTMPPEQWQRSVVYLPAVKITFCLFVTVFHLLLFRFKSMVAHVHIATQICTGVLSQI